jgi:hypothetical protein
MNDRPRHPQLSTGTVLNGKESRYKIKRFMGGGQAGETYVAQVLDGASPAAGRENDDSEVIVKYPRFDQLTAAEVTERLARLNYLFTVEEATLGRLAGASCVAQLLDSGTHNHYHRMGVVHPIFLVQQFIEGQNLTAWTASGSAPQGSFGGLDDRLFFPMAKKLALAVREIHRRLVIHGDIWPENIIVDSKGEPILIDFGQAIFREAVTDPSQVSGRNLKYRAPEGVRSVGGDIYSLGGVLYFLATGQDPLEPIEEIDQLKSQVSESIKQNNPALYGANCGVADIIARCLRYSNKDLGRIRHADGLLEDLAAFTDPQQEKVSLADAEDLRDAVSRLDGAQRPLLRWMAGFRLRAIAALVADMTQGVYDLTGEHEEIVTALTHYVNFLGRGDQYLTVTVPQFWWPENVGVNGRFVSITKIAALRGATIRRIFAISENDRISDPWLNRILEAQMEAIDEITEYQTTGMYEALVRPVVQEEREQMLNDGRHFGLLIKGDDAVAIYPLYREDGLLVGVQFRTGEGLARGLLEEFEVLKSRATPLSQYLSINSPVTNSPAIT